MFDALSSILRGLGYQSIPELTVIGLAGALGIVVICGISCLVSFCRGATIESPSMVKFFQSNADETKMGLIALSQSANREERNCDPAHPESKRKMKRALAPFFRGKEDVESDDGLVDASYDGSESEGDDDQVEHLDFERTKPQHIFLE